MMKRLVILFYILLALQPVYKDLYILLDPLSVPLTMVRGLVSSSQG